MISNQLFSRFSYVVFFAILIANATLVAQSSVVQLPGSVELSNYSHPQPSWPQSSRSELQKKWEDILFKALPQIPDSDMSYDDLVQKLRAYGLPLFIDVSALDDSISPSTLARLEMPNRPIIDRLRVALKKHNATIAMFHDRLEIISLDVASDPEYFLTLAYDVSWLNVNSIALTNSIKNNIDPDGWDDSNGDSVIAVETVNGRKLLTLSSPYENHLGVRRLLSDYLKLSGQRGMLATNLVDWDSKNSRTIELPESMNSRYQRARNRRRSVGGMGGGGGVF